VSFVSPTVFVVATWLAAICGGIGIVAAFVSAIVGYQLSENASREANIKIAEANARQSEAELKLAEIREKLGRPRRLDEEAFSAALKGVRPMPVEITLVGTNPDSHWIAFSILGALEKAGWPIIQSDSLEIFRQTPSMLQICAGNFGGIVVLSKTMSKEESEYLERSPKPKQPDAPFLALWDALWKAVGPNEAAFATCPSVPDGQLHIVVAPRWVIFPGKP